MYWKRDAAVQWLPQLSPPPTCQHPRSSACLTQRAALSLLASSWWLRVTWIFHVGWRAKSRLLRGTLSDCDCCRKFRKWISCGVEEDGSPLSTGRGLAHLIYSWGVLPFHHNFCLSFTHSYYFFFFLCAGACEVLGVFGAPLSGQFVRWSGRRGGWKRRGKKS